MKKGTEIGNETANINTQDCLITTLGKLHSTKILC